jgi:hypothetical protein
MGRRPEAARLNLCQPLLFQFQGRTGGVSNARLTNSRYANHVRGHPRYPAYRLGRLLPSRSRLSLGPGAFCRSVGMQKAGGGFLGDFGAA